MNTKITQNCFLPVNTNERLPEDPGYYIAFSSGDWIERPFAEGKFWMEYDWDNEIGKTFDEFKVSFWLEKKSDMVVLPKAEFKMTIHHAVQKELQRLTNSCDVPMTPEQEKTYWEIMNI